MTVPAKDRPHCVYRFYDADGELLYVGMTSNLPARLAQHQGDKSWWPAVTRIDIDRYPDGMAARNAEQAVMDSEAPKHNQYRSVGQMPTRCLRVTDELWNEVQAVAAEDGSDVSKLTRDFLVRYVTAQRRKRKGKP